MTYCADDSPLLIFHEVPYCCSEVGSYNNLAVQIFHGEPSSEDSMLIFHGELIAFNNANVEWIIECVWQPLATWKGS